MGHNQNSLRGLKGNSYNCSVIAMDNAGLIPDDTGLTINGMTALQLDCNIRGQAYVKRIVDFDTHQPRIREFAMRHPDGVFIVASRNHFSAVVDGVILNCTHNQKILRAWKISKNEPAELRAY